MQPCMIFARESACTCMVSSVPIARPCALALLVRVQCRVSRPRLAMCLVVENYAASSLLVYCAVHIYIFVCARHTGQSTPGEAACAAGAGRRELSPRADSVRCTGAGPQPDHSRTTAGPQPDHNHRSKSFFGSGRSPVLVKGLGDCMQSTKPPSGSFAYLANLPPNGVRRCSWC